MSIQHKKAIARAAKHISQSGLDTMYLNVLRQQIEPNLVSMTPLECLQLEGIYDDPQVKVVAFSVNGGETTLARGRYVATIHNQTGGVHPISVVPVETTRDKHFLMGQEVQGPMLHALQASIRELSKVTLSLHSEEAVPFPAQAELV